MSKSYLAPADFEPCVKLVHNFSTMDLLQNGRLLLEMRTCITWGWLWSFSLGEEIRCFLTAKADSRSHRRIVLSRVFFLFIFYNLWLHIQRFGFLSKQLPCQGIWMVTVSELEFPMFEIRKWAKTVHRSLWVVVICKHCEPWAKMSSSS